MMIENSRTEISSNLRTELNELRSKNDLNIFPSAKPENIGLVFDVKTYVGPCINDSIFFFFQAYTPIYLNVKR